MTISETTRDKRVRRWNEVKSIWEAKRDAADNDNDRAVATAMLEEAEGMLKRLGITDEVVPEVLEPIKKPSKSEQKKAKTLEQPTGVYPHKAEGSADTTGTIGL